MRVFIRAVITGFGLAVGKALYDKVSERLGFESKRDEPQQPPPVVPSDDGGDPVRSPA